MAMIVLLILILLGSPAWADDWPNWRGPQRNGVSTETDLPDTWSQEGENLAWKAPYGGRSGPIILGNHLYLFNTVGADATLQERLMCFDAGTGAVLWEYRIKFSLSDVPPHRIAWASPVGDQRTGNVFVFSSGGTLLSLSQDGKLLWERSLSEEFGLITTHGGRTVSPIIEDDLVIVSGLTANWGTLARGGHRFIAFDKTTGKTVWISTPGGRPYDTTYSPPIAVEVEGTRLLIAGGSDGAVHAIKPQTGEPVWNYPLSKRGMNTGIVVKGTIAIATHGEENLDSSEMGLMTAFSTASEGTIGENQIKWRKTGILGGYSSPVIDDNRIYQVDNSSNLRAFDIETGDELWSHNLATIQKSSPVLADKKLYVGSEDGKFFILRPGPEGIEVLDEEQLGTEENPEPITGSPAVSGGRIFVVTTDSLYAIGSGPLRSVTALPESTKSVGLEPATHIQVWPSELILEPGEKTRFEARLFDGRGRFIRAEKAEWSLEQLGGTIDENGVFKTATIAPRGEGGHVKATIGPLSGISRVRVIPPFPWEEDFETWESDTPARHWINATGKYRIGDLDGNRVLVKLADNPFLRRGRSFLGPTDLSNYTFEADVRSAEQRRQMGSIGVVAQRYALVLMGNHQRLDLESWQPETTRTVRVPMTWDPGTWYRIKLRVDNLPNDKVLARGKVWLANETEPSNWTIERIDSIGNRRGSPAFYTDATAEVYFDNIKIYQNSPETSSE